MNIYLIDWLVWILHASILFYFWRQFFLIIEFLWSDKDETKEELLKYFK